MELRHGINEVFNESEEMRTKAIKLVAVYGRGFEE